MSLMSRISDDGGMWSGGGRLRGMKAAGDERELFDLELIVM